MLQAKVKAADTLGEAVTVQDQEELTGEKCYWMVHYKAAVHTKVIITRKNLVQ